MTRRTISRIALSALAMAQAGCGNDKLESDTAADTALVTSLSTPETSQTSFGVGGPDHPYETVGGRVIEAPFGPVRISELAVRHAAHADSGLLAVIYLRRDGSELKTLRDFPEAVRSGSSGRLGSWTIDNRFSSLPVIVTEGGGTWQGQTCMWTTITELHPSGPVELVTFQQSMSTDGFPDREPEDVSGRVISIERDRGFTVLFSGTRSFKADYVRDGDKYVLRGGDDRALHGC